MTINRSRQEWDDDTPAERASKLSRQGVPAVGITMATDPEGEVLARGNHILKSYWNNPEASAEALADDWFHTGDGGVIDDAGYLTLQDRKKDVIISGGENVSSIEVEDCLFSHPAVEEVAVIGVPDEKWGETVKALVVVGGDADGERAGSHRLLPREIAHYKCPTSVEFRQELARTATGKLRSSSCGLPIGRVSRRASTSATSGPGRRARNDVTDTVDVAGVGRDRTFVVGVEYPAVSVHPCRGAGFRHATGRVGSGGGSGSPVQAGSVTRSFGAARVGKVGRNGGGSIVGTMPESGPDVSGMSTGGANGSVGGAASAGTTGLDGGVAGTTGVDGGVTGCWVAHSPEGGPVRCGWSEPELWAVTGPGLVWAGAVRRARARRRGECGAPPRRARSRGRASSAAGQ